LKINLDLQALTDKKKESLVTAIFFGGLFIIVATVYYIHLADNLWDNLINFFMSLTLAPIPTTGISLPAPIDPANHVNLYMTAFHFCLGLGLLEIAVLFLRVGLHSPVQRIAETIENIFLWLSTSFLIIAYLVNITLTGEWFVFWAGMILILGFAFLTRALVLLAKR